MWTVENRARYDRSKLRYPSDLTDEEWSLAKTEIPRAKQGGNKRTVDVREVMNGLMYVLSTDCQWRAIPKDLLPRSRQAARPVRQRPSSTVRASRALKRGAPDRCIGLCCRQED